MEASKMEEVTYTIKDVISLPPGQRAELIDGDIYMMAPPKYKHQKLLGRLFNKIFNYIADKGGPCEVMSAPFGVFLQNDDENLVEPDISVICDTSKIDDDGCHGAPDWIIEIVSPASRKLDCFVKLEKYRNSGVKEYWIVDPRTRTVRVYDFMETEEKNYTFEDSINTCTYSDLIIDFKEISEGM